VKDDDYRLSFLHGNYITLTNLTARELDRIIEQRLSPLYVSVHATDPRLRTRILGRKKADDLDAKLGKLVRGKIRLHAQIVLMPGINDGISLEKTVVDLCRLYPGVQSVAIVPLGLSDHGRPKDRFLPVTPEYSRVLIREAMRWQEKFRARIGRTFAYLADEFYLQGGVKIPERDYYDDFAQIEDGVGMVRDFLDAFETELGRRQRPLDTLRGTLATGRLFLPTLRRSIERFNHKFGSRLRVCGIENRFLGRNITVAGLLGGQDILSAFEGKNPGDFLIIPGEALSRRDGILVDNLSCKDLSERLGKPVYAGGRTVREFFELLFERL
jgi:putative radical SAM enzyme (TIGR03279 family)